MSGQDLVTYLREQAAAGGPVPGGRLSRAGRVLRRLRPAIPTTGELLAPTGYLPARLAAARCALSAIVAAHSGGVGRIDVLHGPGDWRAVGTGWVVNAGAGGTPARILTAGHVAGYMLVAPVTLPRRMSRIDMAAFPQFFRPARISFGADPDPEADGIPIRAILWPHGLWDVLLCETDRALPAASALPVETDPDWAATGSAPMAVLGYPVARGTVAPAAVAAFDQAFGQGALGTRRLSPGLFTGMEAAQGDPADIAGAAGARLRHDASTLGGSSGSPVFSLATGRVVALHTRGGLFADIDATAGEDPFDFDKGNEAVPLPLLFRDRRMLDELRNSLPVADRAPPRRTPPVPNWSAAMIGPDDEARSPFVGTEADSIPVPLLRAVQADRPDDRDYVYKPPLTALPDRVLPSPDPDRIILNQRSEAACVGFALAALVNDQCRRAGRGTEPVSARMLYEMALTEDEWIDDSQGGTSLRAGIKAFAETGVCAEALAPFVPGQQGWMLTRAVAADARRVRPGAYFRLRRRLGDFQSAIHEVGAIAVSARIHKGWVRSDGRRIHRIRHCRDPIGEHAFIVTGYDDDGFIIQNSWGPNWGGWDGQDGLAHWRYADWAENLIDGWVLRLAPSAPGAFGLRPAGPPPADSALPPSLAALPAPHRHALLGHLVQAERDGVVTRGRLGLGIAPVREAAAGLEAGDFGDVRHLAILCHDPFLGTAAIARIAAYLTPVLLGNRIFPLHLVYGADELATLSARMRAEAALVRQRFRADTAGAGPYLVRRARRLCGRLWSDFAGGAARAAEPGGALWQAGAALCLDAAHGRPLSLIAFGAGDIAASALLADAVARRTPRVARLLRVAPVTPASALPATAGAHCRDWLLSPEPPVRDLPPYPGDWCDLVAAIADSGGTPRAGERSGSELPPDLAAACVSAGLLNALLGAILGRAPSGTRRFGEIVSGP